MTSVGQSLAAIAETGDMFQKSWEVHMTTTEIPMTNAFWLCGGGLLIPECSLNPMSLRGRGWPVKNRAEQTGPPGLTECAEDTQTYADFP